MLAVLIIICWAAFDALYDIHPPILLSLILPNLAVKFAMTTCFLFDV